MNLTPRQTELVQAIADYRAARSVSPTMRELGLIMGIANTVVLEYVEACILAGALQRDPTRPKGAPRNLTLTPEAQRSARSPLTWKIAGTLSAKGVRWTAAKELAAQ